MCGVLGYSGKRLPSLNRFTESLKMLDKRGPDAFAIEKKPEQICFGHTRLSIIDPTPESNQPFVSKETGSVLIFNGEIYNYKQLKAEEKDLGFDTSSDTEVISKLYDRYGLDMIPRLVGIFAFAIYDPRLKKTILVRDHFGVKPLYFHFDKEGLYFSSETKPLRKLLGNRCPIDHLQIQNYFSRGTLLTDEKTFYKGIEQIPAGEYRVFDHNSQKLSSGRYWSLTPVRSSLTNENEVVDQAIELLNESIRLNMVADCEVGFSLSSGIDSQILYRMAERLGYENIRAYTFGFNETEYDESNIARQVAGKNNFFTTKLFPDQLIDELSAAVNYFDMPLGGLGTLSAYHMMKKVNADGLRVMLAGEGADELFSGYSYHFGAHFKDLLIQEDYTKLRRELVDFNSMHGTSYEPNSAEFVTWINNSVSSDAKAPDGTSLSQRRSVSSDIDLSRYGNYFSSTMASDLFSNKIPKLLYFQDRAAMANSVETRVPFLDYRLAEFMYSLPPEYKIIGGRGNELGTPIPI